MTENELEMLARHLGHDAKTHKEYYRLSHHTVELSKVNITLCSALLSGFYRLFCLLIFILLAIFRAVTVTPKEIVLLKL